jgi:hypothetical protein
VVYNGSSTVAYNLFDEAANPVSEGTGTMTISCGL